MSKQSHSINSNGADRKRPKVEEESQRKRVKADPMEDDNGNQIEEATTTQEDTNTISAEEFFVGVLSKIPTGSKKKTLNSFIRTLLQLKETIKDEDDLEDDLPIKAIEPPVINPIILPEPVPQAATIVSPRTVERSPHPVTTSYAPATMASGSNIVTYTPIMKTSVRGSPAKMPALEACPPLTTTSLRPQATLTVPQVQALPTPVNPQDIIRAQHQIRQEKVKMIPPQTMSPMDASIQQKERAFHQAALQQQQMSAPQMQGSDNDALLVTNLKNKILMSIQSNHDGKATDEDINRYLRQNYFMILDNNQYIYQECVIQVPNPWIHRPPYIRQFMSQPAPAQPQQQPTMMLPPRLPQMQMQQMPQISQMQQMPQMQNIQGNMLHPQMVQGLGGTISPAGSLQNWPNQQNILLNTLQPNIISTSQGIPILNSPKAGSTKP